MHRYVKVSEIVATLHVEAEFLRSLEEEGLIHVQRSSEDEPVMSAEDADRVRVAQLLTVQLDVNLAGVEVVVHMRDSMVAMQRQFAEILDALVAEVRGHAHR